MNMESMTAPIRVFPSVIEFNDCRPNTLHVMTIYVQNISKQANRIRFKHPKSDYFTLNYTPTEPVAPGLEVRAEVEFCIPENHEAKEFYDTLVILCGEHKATVNLCGFSQRGRLEVESNGLVEVGTVVKGNSVSRYIELRNVGSQPCEYNITGSLPPNVTISPMQGTVHPSGGNSRISGRLKIDYNGTELGTFRACANLEVDGQPSHVIDISASVVEQRLELVLPDNWGKSNGAMNFGKLYFGQKVSRKVILVNYGPMACQYSIMFRGGDGFHLYQDTPRSDAEDEADVLGDGELAGYTPNLPLNTPLQITPCEGVLDPYGQIELEVTFSPQNPKQAKGFKTRGDLRLHDQIDFVLDAMISCTDTSQNIPLSLAGRALKPLVQLSKRNFKFGSCPTNDRRDIMFTVSNKGEELPVEFSINKIAFFSSKPNSGKLLPGQSQNVLVTFSPGQMGNFRSSLHLVLNKGISVIPLNVTGSSLALGERKVIPGGPKARMADFQPEVKYVDEEEVSRQERERKEQSFKRLPPWEKKKRAMREAEGLAADSSMAEPSFVDEDEELEDEIFGGVKSFDPQFTYAVSDLVRKQNHRDQYADFLKRASDARAQRREELKAKAAKLKKKRHKKIQSSSSSLRRRARSIEGGNHSSDDEEYDDEYVNSGEDTDMDMDTRGGLSSPRLDVPQETEPLWLERPINSVLVGSQNQKGRRRHRTKAHDEDKLLKRKYKPKPTTQAEMIDCAMQISSSDLVLVGAAPKVMDFGIVSVNSKSAKCLGITNDTGQNILVEVLFEDHEELAQSFPKSQVIPAGAMAGFDVTFMSTAQPPQGQSNKFRHTLNYVVNGNHKFKVTVMAEVIPIKIELDRQEIGLRFDDDNLGPETSETITLTNTGNAPARFQWVHAQPNNSSPSESNKNMAGISAFTAAPESDVIEPKQSKEVTVTFTPSSKAPKIQNLLLRVRGGYDEVLTCSGEIEEPVCSFVERKLDFGQIPVGIVQQKQFGLRNTGNHSAVYSIDQTELPTGLSVSPARGKIPPTSTIQLKVSYVAREPLIMDASSNFLYVQLRGGRDLRLPLLCEALLPEVAILESHTDFEGVTIGSNALRTLTFQNKSTVPAVLCLDLSAHSEFEVALSEDNLNEEAGYKDDDLESLLRPVTANAQSSTAQANIFQTVDDLDFDFDEPLDAMQGMDDEVSRFELKIPALKMLKLSMLFIPRQEMAHGFQLPIEMAGTKNAFLEHIVSGEGLRPRLLLSSTMVNFETKVVHRDKVKKLPFYQEITVTNHHDEPLRWEVDVSDIEDKVNDDGTPAPANFTIKPSGGNLDPGDSCMVKVGFIPREDIQYNAVLPVYLDGDTSREYIKINLMGAGAFPRLQFDTTEVVLPTVPLGVKTRAQFMVQNDGYDSLELQTKLPPESQRIPIQIEFPEGTNIGVGRPEVPVVVTFCSRKPISFTAKVDFVDTEGNKFGIRVTGTTDNSLLTSFPFVAAVREGFDYFSAERYQPIQFLPRQQIRMMLEESESNASLPLAQRKSSTGSAIMRGRSTTIKGDSALSLNAFNSGGKNRQTGAFVADASLVETASCSKDSLQSIVRFLNITSFEIPVTEFPEDLINGNGQQLFDLVESLSGKRVPGRVRSFSANKKEVPNQLLTQYAAMLKFLKSRGGMLHELRAEQFLSKEDYVKFRERQNLTEGMDLGLDGAASACGLSVVMTGSGSASTLSAAHGQALLRRHQCEREHTDVSLKAWSCTILQILKLFVLNRVTPRQFRNLPGVSLPSQEVFKQISPAASNIYSSAETLLLEWINLHHAMGSNIILSSGGGGVPSADIIQAGEVNPFQQNEFVINFDSDLSNGVVLCTTIASHCPSLVLPGRSLASVVLEPTQQSQCVSNLRAVMNSLKELGLDYTKNPEHMLLEVANARDNLLFILYLYQNLPQFVPKATIEFSCALGSKVTKAIELRNPSSNLVGYNVHLDGASNDFNVPSKCVLIEPHGVANLPVELVSRFSKSVEATLMLRPDANTGGASTDQLEGAASTENRMASALVFRLVSQIHSRRSLKTIKCCTRTYEPLQVEVEVTNPFNHDGKFALHLSQDFVSLDAVEKKAQADREKKKSGKKKKQPRRKKPVKENIEVAEALTEKDEVKEALPRGFSTKTPVIKLKALETTTFRLQFLPFMPGDYKCQLVFLDENVGEFLYEVVGEAGYPQPCERMVFTTESRTAMNKLVPVSMTNKLLEKAKASLIEDLDFTGAARHFEVAIDSPFFAGPAAVSLNEEEPTSINVEFNPQSAGVYPCQLVLKSATHIRVIEFEATATTPPVISELDFSAPARQVIRQGIPIMNTSNNTWTIQATLEGHSCFSCKRSITVNGDGGNEEFVIEFNPPWIGEYSAKVTLVNTTTNETMMYNLNGVATTPLAEDHVVIECQAREKLLQNFKVPNQFKNSGSKFNVESDLPHVSGNGSISVEPGHCGSYSLTVHPLLGGVYSGSLTFSLGEGKPYVWYTVEVRASSPAPESTLEITSFIRKAVAVEITLVNPLEKPVEFEVNLGGRGLIGDPVFMLEANESASYELVYSPLVHGEQLGSISFVNDKVGEVWYELKLKALPTPPVTLDLVSCPVGTQTSIEVSLENPTSGAVEIRPSVSNPRNFSVRNIPVILPPYSVTKVNIDYMPSSIDLVEESTVSFSDPEIGDWVFNVSGKGERPDVMPTVTTTTCIGMSDSCSFVFRNPFPRAIKVCISMETDYKVGSVDSPFSLLLSKDRHLIQPFGTFVVPFAFSPKEMMEMTAAVTVAVEDSDMVWKYPLQGLAEAPPHHETFTAKVRARETLSTVIDVPLIGLGHIATPEPFVHELVTEDSVRKVVERSLTVKPLETRISKKDQVIPFELTFEPLKPFSTTVDLIVTRRSGGRWRFQIHLAAEEPVIDDTITVEATIGQTSSVAFRLVNQFPVSADFKAYLTVDSAYQFAVFPTNGILPPAHAEEGCQFVVSFTPTEYGKDVQARLMIETSEMQWSYQLKGSIPSYIAPAAKAKVSSRPRKEVLNALKEAQTVTKKRFNKRK